MVTCCVLSHTLLGESLCTCALLTLEKGKLLERHLLLPFCRAEVALEPKPLHHFFTTNCGNFKELFSFLNCLFWLVGLLLLFFWNSKTMEINYHNPTWKLFFLYLNMYKWSWFYLLFNETIFITFALVVVILHQVLAQCNTSKTLWMSLFVMGWQLTLNSNMVPYYLSSGVKLAKRIPEHTHILLYVQTKGGFQVTNTNGNTGGFSARQTSWQWPFKVLEKNH